MTSLIVKISLIPLLLLSLSFFGSVLNETFLINYFTQFFVFLRTIIKPLNFLWDFETSFALIGWALSLFIAYWAIKIFIIIKNIFISND